MSLPVYVDAYPGYKANERPYQFVLDDEIYEIAAVLERWHEPDAMYFKVQSTKGKTYLLRYVEADDEWTLQSGFHGDELLARPGISLVTVDADAVHRAEKMIDSCEHCHPDDAQIPLDWILDRVTGKNPVTTDYILTEGARCPTCKHEITEKTLIDPGDD